MAGTNNAAGCAGWVIAGLLALVLIGQCTNGDSDAPKDTTPRGLVALAAPQEDGRGGQAVSRRLYVQATGLNCRAERSTRSAVMARLSTNSYVLVVEEREGWSRIDNNPDCWARSSYLGPTRVFVTTPRPAPRETPRRSYASGGDCPCSSGANCYGPRGGRYCITSGGNKRYR